MRGIILHTHGEGAAFGGTPPLLPWGSLQSLFPLGILKLHPNNPIFSSIFLRCLTGPRSHCSLSREWGRAAQFSVQMDRKWLMMGSGCLIFLSSELKKKLKSKKIDVYEQLQNHRIVKVRKDLWDQVQPWNAAQRYQIPLAKPGRRWARFEKGMKDARTKFKAPTWCVTGLLC